MAAARCPSQRQSWSDNCVNCELLTGIVARAECVSANGRTYPKVDLERAVCRYAAPLLRAQPLFGELEHPAYFSSTYKQLQAVKISHKILALWWSGNDLHAVVQLLPTPAGRLVQSLYAAGGALGCSCRGWSSTLPCDQASLVEGLSKASCRTVASDYELIAIDLTCLPAFDTYLRPVPSWWMPESPATG